MAGVAGSAHESPLPGDPSSPQLPPPPSQKPYHSKRPHRKSRKGCKNCKARKVKCDEVRPVCSACRLRNDDCIYADLVETHAAKEGASPASGSVAASSTIDTATELNSSPPSSSVPSSPSGALILSSRARSMPAVMVEPLCRPCGIDETDMKLLWFYTHKTCASFSVDSGKQGPVDDIMRSTVVQYAFESPFLMHTLLALASLQQQNLELDFDRSRALQYRAMAFEGYRKAVQEAKSSNYAALLVNSLLLTALAAQNFREPDSKELYIIDWVIVWRGIGIIFDTIHMPSISDLGLQALFYRPPLDLQAAATHVPDHLLQMIDSLEPKDVDYAELDVYRNALPYVGTLYQNLRQTGADAMMKLRIVTWFTFLPRDFIDLVLQKRTIALVILAHYAAFLKLTEDVWWLKEVGNRSLKDLIQYLGPSHHHLLWMPLRVMLEDDEAMVSEVILSNDNAYSSMMLVGDEYVMQQQAEERSQLTWVDEQGREVRLASGVLDDSEMNDVVMNWQF